MSKKVDKTMEAQYREILSRKGIDLDSCRVLGFIFPSTMGQELFHFCIMAEKAKYVLYDGNGPSCNIIIGRDEKTREIEDLALNNGGKRVVPKMR